MMFSMPESYAIEKSRCRVESLLSDNYADPMKLRGKGRSSPNNNPLEPALSQNTPTHSHDTVSETPRSLSFSLSLSVSLSFSYTSSRVKQPQGEPNAGSFSLVLFSHSRTTLLVHSVSGADKALMQLASNHGVRVGH
jgi:hypothetical protein